MAKGKRGAFSPEYKAEVVDRIRKSGKSIGAVARELDLTETAVRRWVQQAEIDSGRGPEGALTTAGARSPRSCASGSRRWRWSGRS